MNILYNESEFYSKSKYEKLIEQGEYLGYKWFIISYGTHPCCYITLDKFSKFYKKHYDDIPLSVHGGLTYSAPNIKFNYLDDKNLWIIGWDYIQAGDFCYWLNSGKIWTLNELKLEIKNAIEQLIILEKQNSFNQ